MKTKPEALELAYPICRAGRVMEGSRPISTRESYRLGQAVVDDVARYGKDVTGTLEKLGARDVSKVGDAERIDHFAPIIRLPLFTFALGVHEVELRQSATICHHARRSKTWTRVNLRAGSRQLFPLRETKIVLDNLCEWAHALLPVVARYYQTMLGETLPGVELKDYYDFHLRGVDISDAFLDEPIALPIARALGAHTTDGDPEPTQQTRELLHELYPSFTRSEALASSAPWELLGTHTENASGLFASEIADSEAFFYGICGHSLPFRSRRIPADGTPDKPVGYLSAARELTRQLLTHYAQAF